MKEKKEVKYVIKNIETNSYLYPYEEDKCWVELEKALTFNIEIGKEEPVDYVDYVWLHNEKVELVKVKIKSTIEELLELPEKKELDYILSKNNYLEIKNILKGFRENTYNSHGTKLKNITILHHIIYNLIRDKYYLKGIELNKRRCFLTHEDIIGTKEIIFNYKEEKNKDKINKIFKNKLTSKDLEKIKNKLKKQIE
jgi:hypothetical protein